MNKDNLISSIQNDLDAYQSYIENNFEEFSHSPVDSGTLYEFGKQTYYVLGGIIEALRNNLD